METKDLMVFGFDGHDVRTVMIDGEPWWVGKDICNFFGDSDSKRSLSRIDEHDRKYAPIIDALNREQNMIIINESGLYSLLFTFQPNKARGDEGAQNDPHIQERIKKIEKFKKWVTSEVLPAIRKTGGYLSPVVDFSDPDNLQKVFDSWKEERRKRLEAEARTNRLIHNSRTYTTTEIAKELNFRSAQELNQALLDKGVQYKDHRGVWLLNSEYANKGFVNIKQEEKNGTTLYYSQWTGLGRDWLVGMFS